jgi:hypothetical protein
MPIAVLSATPRQPLGVLRADEVHARVGHVDLGARHIRLSGRVPTSKKPRAERRFRFGALDGLLLHADQPLGEVDVGEGLLHRLRHQLPLQLDIFLRPARPAGARRRSTRTSCRSRR